MGPDPTPITKPGPYQAAAGLARVGLHLLPVFLGFLDDVFMGHAWQGREQTWVSLKELSEEWQGSERCHPPQAQVEGSHPVRPSMERGRVQGLSAQV